MTTTTMTTTTTDDRTFYNCPPWCRRLDHDADVIGPNDPPIHYGPDFGAVAVQARVGAPSEAIVYLGGESAYESDPAKLRSVAADMVRAAEWLEPHRAEAST